MSPRLPGCAVLSVLIVAILGRPAGAQTLDVSQDRKTVSVLGRIWNPAWVVLRTMPEGTEPGAEQPVPSFPGARVFSGPFASFDEYNRLRASSSGLTWVPRGDGWAVGEVVPGSPGDVQGVQLGDVLVGHARTPAQLCLVQQPVHFQVDRAGQRLDVTLRCTDAERPQVYAKMLNDQTGYLRVAFVRASYGYLWLRLSNAVDALKAQGMKSLVLDLRGTTGGHITLIREAADLFLRRGVIVRYRAWDGVPVSKLLDPVDAQDGQFDVREPLVVLVDQDTNNGGELLAAALQENGRATLLGQQTAGGCVVHEEGVYFGPQRTDGQAPGVLGGVSYPVATWLTPSGNSVCGHGLTPDVPVDQQGSERGSVPDAAADRQLAAALDLLRAPADQP